MNSTLDHQLGEIFELYAADWGPVGWDVVVAEARNYDVDAELASIFNALSYIEADSQFQQMKIRRAHIDRYRPVRDFVVLWMAEELEHARMFRHVGRAFGSAGMQPGDHALAQDRRAIVSRAATSIARFVPQLTGTYCVLGAIQEHVALTTYRYLATVVPSPALRGVLLATAKQEARHLRFYSAAAEVLLSRSRLTQRLTRQLLLRYWRPPGVDLLGNDQFLSIFRPILLSDEYRKRLRRMDALLTHFHGLEDLTLMDDYLKLYCEDV